MNPKTIFYLGDQSRYGMAHLEPILEHFDVRAVVVGTDATWRRFRRSLEGDPVWVDTPRRLSPRGVKRMLGDAARRRHERRRVADLGAACARHDVTLVRHEDANAAPALHWLGDTGCDLVLSAAYPQIFGKELLGVPARGAINFHPSLLPRFQGAHPHFWAIAKGEDESGVTAHFMTEEIDRGALVAQRPFPIADLYYSELYAEIERHTPALVRDVATFLERGYEPIPQQSELASRFRNDRQIHHRLLWGSMSGRELYDLVRTEVAFCFFAGERVAVDRATWWTGNRNLTNGVQVPAGMVVDLTPDAIVVSTGRQREVLAIQQIAGRPRGKGLRAWVRARGVRIGARFD